MRTYQRKDLLVACLSLVGVILLGFYNSQVDTYLQILASPSVDFVVTTPEGQHTGYDPQKNKLYEEVSGTNYGYMKTGSLNLDYRKDPSPEFVTSAQNPPQFGTYSIKFYGSKLSKFEFGVWADRYNRSEKIEEVGIIGEGAVSEFMLVFNSDTTKGINVIRSVSVNSFRQDLELSYKIGWISNKGIYNSLLQKLNSASRSYDRGQVNAATNTLQAFNNELEAQEEKNLSGDAATILKEDAELLIQKWGTEQ